MISDVAMSRVRPVRLMLSSCLSPMFSQVMFVRGEPAAVGVHDSNTCLQANTRIFTPAEVLDSRDSGERRLIPASSSTAADASQPAVPPRRSPTLDLLFITAA